MNVWQVGGCYTAPRGCLYSESGYIAILVKKSTPFKWTNSILLLVSISLGFDMFAHILVFVDIQNVYIWLLMLYITLTIWMIIKLNNCPLL